MFVKVAGLGTHPLGKSESETLVHEKSKVSLIVIGSQQVEHLPRVNQDSR